ncbi:MULTISPECIES: hypothetical protein [Aliivibrio]|uniref:hypothetical protein n=1 Tax=Aliivibrio TaxID=511678 RepID=UPI0011472645|nr:MULTISPECIES: hypothetical protein [Aliivibrio]
MAISVSYGNLSLVVNYKIKLNNKKSIGLNVINKIQGVVLSLVLLLSGCTIVDSSSIVIGNTRQQTNIDDIRLYRTAPTSYEEIAMISASAGHDFKSDGALVNEAMEQLKKEAAKVGANAVLLTEIRERSGTVTMYRNISSNADSNNFGVATSGDRYTRVKGIAIFVKK